MRRTLRVSVLSLLTVCVGHVAHADDRPSFDRSFELPPARAVAVRPERAAQIASLDQRTGAPSFVWGRGEPVPTSAAGSPAQAARHHARAYRDLFGLTSRALSTVTVSSVHDTGRGGIVVELTQELDGIPVIASGAKVLMRRDLSLVAIGGGLRADATSETAKRAQFALPHAGAVARALSDLYGASVPSSVLVTAQAQDEHGYVRFGAAPGRGFRFSDPARARRVFFPLGQALVAAYYVEVFASTGAPGWDSYGYVIDAATGDVLQRRNLTAHADFSYRVFADTSGDLRPLDGPIADFTPHPTGTPDQSAPGFIAPSLVTIDGFNVHGDPWLPDNATEAIGNNVDAYTDHDNSDNIAGGDVRATLTQPGVFDHVFDPSQSPLATVEQQKAAVTQLFYTTNWLHDYWYDSGFDEQAGNAQQDNYGRGGDAGDRLHCQAQDAVDQGQSNNANMATPADGASPRMQLYLWSGTDERSLQVSGFAQDPPTGAAGFGPASFDVTSTIVLADDGTGTATDACEPITNAVAGQIVLIDRGNCTFQSKVVTAEAAGALGVLIANNQGGGPPAMPGGGGTQPAIGALSISQSDGNTIKAALTSGAVTATLYRLAGPQADSAVDNLVVAHEWGHYLHHRLVDCGLNQCGGESEGWGDFLALTLAVRESDDLGGVYSSAVYATFRDPDASYFGTRRYPYSTDMAKNPLTFEHIQNSATLPGGPPMSPGAPFNAEVHNTGEVFASMLWEGYASILAEAKLPSPRYTFDEARRRMTDYVVAGMQLAPVEPTFTEQRDALIAAAYAADPADALLIAEGFAKRGAGSCAVSPPRDAFDNEGVVESFEVAPAVAVRSVVIDDSATPCDGDGVVDVGEIGRVTVTLANHGYLEAPATTVTLSSDSQGVTFPSGASIDVPTLAGFAEAAVTFDVTITGATAPSLATIVATAVNQASCNPSVVSTSLTRMHYDDVPASSASDDFESLADAWTLDGDASELIWSRTIDEDGNRLWHGVDYSSISDTALESPAITVSQTEPLVLTFSHRYKFEASDDGGGNFITWDGGVIEISTDGGLSWDDASTIVDPGYTGTIANLADNPLSDRDGFVGESEDYPAMHTVSIDFGSALAGQTVQFRFRIGSDQAASEIGWEIDDVGFTGIDGTPFPSVQPNAATCDPPDPPTGQGGGLGGTGETFDDPADPDGLYPAGGCSCRTAGTDGAGSAGWALGLLFALAFGRRRTRRQSLRNAL